MSFDMFYSLKETIKSFFVAAMVTFTHLFPMK